MPEALGEAFDVEEEVVELTHAEEAAAGQPRGFLFTPRKRGGPPRADEQCASRTRKGDVLHDLHCNTAALDEGVEVVAIAASSPQQRLPSDRMPPCPTGAAAPGGWGSQSPGGRPAMSPDDLLHFSGRDELMQFSGRERRMSPDGIISVQHFSRHEDASVSVQQFSRQVTDDVTEDVSVQQFSRAADPSEDASVQQFSRYGEDASVQQFSRCEAISPDVAMQDDGHGWRMDGQCHLEGSTETPAPQHSVEEDPVESFRPTSALSGHSGLPDASIASGKLRSVPPPFQQDHTDGRNVQETQVQYIGAHSGSSPDGLVVAMGPASPDGLW